MTLLMRVRTVFAYGAGSPGLMTNYLGKGEVEINGSDAQVAVDRVRDALQASPNIWPTTFAWSVAGEVDVLDDATGEVTTQMAATPRNGAGSGTGGLGPLPVGLLLKARTDSFVSGRRLIGRTYFVPVQATLTTTAVPSTGTRDAVVLVGTAMLNAGLTQVLPYVWSRPRPATAVGPGRPAGPAREARVGSSAPVVSYSCPPNYVVLTSRRD